MFYFYINLNQYLLYYILLNFYFFLFSVIIYFLSFFNFSSSFLKTSRIALVELLNFAKKVNKINPTIVDKIIIVILSLNVKINRFLDDLYFFEILSLK